MRALTFAAGEGSRAPSMTSGADLDYVIPRWPESAAPRRFEKRSRPKRNNSIEAQRSLHLLSNLQSLGRAHQRRQPRLLVRINFLAPQALLEANHRPRV